MGSITRASTKAGGVRQLARLEAAVAAVGRAKGRCPLTGMERPPRGQNTTDTVADTCFSRANLLSTRSHLICALVSPRMRA